MEVSLPIMTVYSQVVHVIKFLLTLFTMQHNTSLTNLSEVMESFNSVSAPADIGTFVSGQNVSVKVYPPPMADFKAPDLPPPKQPDAPPINLVSTCREISIRDYGKPAKFCSPLDSLYDNSVYYNWSLFT